jgi:hypothetical protein
MEGIFTNIYESAIWGDNQHKEYKGTSGGGSDVDYNIITYIPFLKKFISDNNIKTVVDLGSGDFRCGPLIYDSLDIQYFGYDTYGKVVAYNSSIHSPPKYNFTHMDFHTKKEEIISGDLCILKDVLQHWTMEEIYTFLDYIVTNKKFKYILICNCCGQVQDNPSNEGRSTPLSVSYLPLKKYNPVKMFNYNTKEVSVITIV